MNIKFFFVSLLFIISINACFSQMVLNSAMMPEAGDTIHYRNVGNFSGDVELTGEDFYWDMSNSLGNQWVADTFVVVSSTPLMYNSVFNNPSSPKYKATCASPQANIVVPVGSFEFSNIYNYYKLIEDTVFSQVGMAITVNNIPIPIKFTDIDNMYNFPFEYGGFDSCYSSYSVTVPSFGHNSRKQTRLNYFEGYGTLITPVDTFFDAIRIKTIIQSRDSVYIEQYNLPFAINTTTTEYKWFADGYRGPIAQISVVSGQGSPRTSFKYRDTPPPSLAKIVENEFSVSKISPNPFQDKLSIVFNNPTDFDLQLYSLNGQVLWQSHVAKTDFFELPQNAINALTKGVYFIRLSIDSKTEIHQIIKY